MDFFKVSGWTFYFVKMPENQFLTRCPASWRWEPACERRGVSLSVSMVRNSDPLSPAQRAPIWPTSNRILKNKKCLIYSMFKIHENNYRSFVTTMKAIKKKRFVNCRRKLGQLPVDFCGLQKAVGLVYPH